MRVVEGRVWCFGDDVDTDVMVPGQYLVDELPTIVEHVMEGVRPGFADLVSPNDVIVAGTNFGTGSSREMAPRALQAAGIAVVIAQSFARIFYRNCINVGLAPVECSGAGAIEEGQHVTVDLSSGEVVVAETGQRLVSTALPPDIAAILDAGGLESYLAARFRER